MARKIRISNEITELMKIKGISITYLAGELGKSNNTIERWITGETAPNKKYVEPLASALNVTPEYLTSVMKFSDKRVQPNRGPRVTSAYKDNFWNRRRIAKGLKIEDISKKSGISKKAAWAYFAGAKMPNDATIEKLCKLLDVDVIQGTSEFRKANASWEHSKSTKQNDSVNEEPVKQLDKNLTVVKSNTNRSDDDDNVPVSARARYIALKNLYGKIDFETFEKVREALCNSK